MGSFCCGGERCWVFGIGLKVVCSLPHCSSLCPSGRSCVGGCFILGSSTSQIKHARGDGSTMYRSWIRVCRRRMLNFVEMANLGLVSRGNAHGAVGGAVR